MRLSEDFVITKILAFHILYSAAGTSARRTARNTWALIMKYEGETEYTTSHGMVLSNRTHAILLPEGSSYEWRCTQSGGYYVVEFTAEASHADVTSFAISNPDEIEKIFLRLEQGNRMQPPYFQMTAMAGLYKMFSYLVKTEEKQYHLSSKYRRIAPSVDYIHRYYDRDLSNDLIAAESGVSTVYFRKIFTEHYGISPIKYLHKLRIDKAKEMLRSEYGSVGAIAKTLGYSSIQHFSKTFREYTGLSPKQYAMTL